MDTKHWYRTLANFLRLRPDSEKAYQERIVSFLLSIGLGWQDDEIVQQPAIPIGSTKRIIPDILIKRDKINAFIIEIKAANHIRQVQNIRQLESYLKLLDIPFGLYVGERLELYYKLFGKEIRRIFSIEMNTGDKEWDTFAALFSRETFNSTELQKFCEEAIAKESEVESAKRYVEQIVSGNNELLRDLLRKHWTESAKSTPWIDYVLKHINISVTSNTDNIHPKPQIAPISAAMQALGPVHYSINGKGFYGVGRTALYIVRHIVTTNPQMSFREIQKTVYTNRNNIKSFTDIEQYRKTGRDTYNRWFEKEPLTSKDGVMFAVSTQWTRDNIIPLIEIGRKFGLDIRKIKTTTP